MARYQILYWQDIPAQIKVTEPGKRPISRQLPDRYQQKIDAQAMRLGLYGTGAYLDQWHWSDPVETDSSAEVTAAQLIRQYEEQP
ncbi:MAG: virulence factor [Bryobacterales bacterium]|nr:virulence factor [Bryobacterales bacterium]